MRKLKAMALALAVVALVYLTGSYAAANLNPFTWPAYARIIVAFLALSLSSALYTGYLETENNHSNNM